MAKLDVRLEKLEGTLGHRQFVYKMIDEHKRFNSLDECSLFFIDKGWKTLDKNHADCVFDAIEDKLKGLGKSPETISATKRRASNEMLFLHLLSVRMMSSFIQDKYRHSYNRLYLDVLLMTLGHAIQKPDEDEKTESMQSTLGVWKHRATRHLYHLYSEKMVAAEIGKRYFEGRDLLLKAERELLESMIQGAELHIEKVNEISRQDEENEIGLQDFIVNPETVMQDVLEHLEDAVQYEVDMIKAEVYSNMDKPEKAYGIWGSYT